MAKNSIQDLRDHLFATIESLRDEKDPMEVELAKAICAVADKIIDSARIEVKAMEVSAEIVTSGFFRNAPLPPNRSASGEARRLPPGKPNGRLAA